MRKLKLAGESVVVVLLSSRPSELNICPPEAFSSVLNCGGVSTVLVSDMSIGLAFSL